jgi:hypothetical protein
MSKVEQLTDGGWKMARSWHKSSTNERGGRRGKEKARIWTARKKGRKGEEQNVGVDPKFKIVYFFLETKNKGK